MLSHTPQSPLLYLGKGKTTFTEREGNFSVTDDVTERIPLRRYAMTQAQNGVDITLSDAEDTKVRPLAAGGGARFRTQLVTNPRGRGQKLGVGNESRSDMSV